MSSSRHTGLPDPDIARREIGERLAELAGLIADEVERHANAAPVVPRDLRPWFVSLMDAFPCFPGFMEAKVKNPAWKGIPLGRGEIAPYLVDMHLTGADILRSVVDSEYWTDGRLPRARRKACLSDLRANLRSLESILRAVTPPSLPPRRPPAFARLHDHVVAATVADQLAELISEGRVLCEVAATGASRSPVESRWGLRCRVVLAQFLTTEVSERYAEATRGLEEMEGLVGFLRDFPQRSMGRKFSSPIQRVYVAYLVLALTYVTEVLEYMPDYAEASGQGKRRDSVTVYGNVGAINSEVNHSHLSVAQTVTDIGATINAVADRGETDVADALRALAEAVQHAPELTERQRAELLDNVADLAEAANAPDEPRRLSRARAALAMISNAAGASAQLAGAVHTWQQVAGQLF